MLSNHDSNDQAEGLRKRMEETQPITEEKQNETSENTISRLPPRSEVHRKKEKKKTKFRIRFPLIRLLALTFVIIVCIVATYNFWKDNIQFTNSTVAEKPIGGHANSNIDIVEMNNQDTEAQDSEEVVKPNEHNSDSSNDNQAAGNQERETLEVTDESGSSESSQENVQENATIIQEEPPIAPESANNAAEPNKTAEEQIVYHRVKAGENLYRISLKYYKSRAGEEKIKRANGLDANGTVMTGQLLKIPVK